MKQKILNILKKRKILTLVILLVLVSSTTALTWMWLSNTIVDDVEVTEQPMTLTLVQSPDVMWLGAMATWTFNLSVDAGSASYLYILVYISWAEYNSTEDYFDVIDWYLNGSSGCVRRHYNNCWQIASYIYGPDGEHSYQWQVGDFTWFTFGILFDKTMPVGNYHFEFVISVPLV